MGEENFPLDRIDFAAFDSHTLSSQTFTGGSTGTEGAAVAAMKACKELVESFKPIRDALKKKASEEAEKEGKNSTEVTWPAVCAAAEQANLPMQALGHHGGEKSKDKLAYNCYGVGCSEVELDVLTGEVLVLRTDLMYDSGKSLNPMVDIGQAEGAFTMGMGFITPRQLNVTLLKNEALKGHVLSSKASGEPPLVMSSSILCAMRQAIASCRSDAGFTDFFELNPPCTTETVLGLVAPAVEKYGKMVR